ncbi:ShlB/FhaC/HecB family hemolysin secretion/activation protein [Proteus myxofaciens]|uniref:Channel-forming transporter/TpsB family cytolysins activator n=1 Tax=Proteus myxofaciens ATCC 19692 TaxID=1354337 RepID=A0A198GD43_9GAMM|nr:ShlB/FhaC/HecB family hemolysin secretion/activation protein [Proteus myxofaciens]OAT34830.1 channel-forming transporter/TpsB family cytolysins activator [Proteus myxofaciens ATCC 19692]
MKKTIFLLILLTAFSSSRVTANEINDLSSIGESRRALQDSQREINQLIEQNRYQQLRENALETTPAPTLITESEHCLPINGVYIQGITLLNENDLDSLSPLPEHCIKSIHINRLVKELTQRYIKKGYITARIQFLRPNENGELGLYAIEGFVERINGGDRNVNITMLFPHIEGKPLTLTILDQGLDQANRLQSNKVKLDILPGTKLGGSIIQLSNQRQASWHINVTNDNYGQKNSGRWLVRANASLDSPLGLSDFISLNTNITTDNPDTRFNRAYTLLYSVPYGAFTFSTFGSYSEYEFHQPLQTRTVRLHGDTSQVGLRTDYVFYRNQTQINTLNVQVTHKRIRNYFSQLRLDLNSPTLTTIEIGANHLHIVRNGVVSINASAEKAVSWFGADNSPYVANGNSNNYRFTKVKLFTNWQQRFSLFEHTFLFNSLLFAQYSPDALPGVEWLSLTDKNAIRGFDKSTLSGDNGGYFRNTLSYPYKINSLSITPRIGLDTGRVHQHNSAEGWRSGYGISSGLNFQYKKAQLDIEIAKGHLLYYQKKTNKTKDPTQLLVRFSYLF